MNIKPYVFMALGFGIILSARDFFPHDNQTNCDRLSSAALPNIREPHIRACNAREMPYVLPNEEMEDSSPNETFSESPSSSRHWTRRVDEWEPLDVTKRPL